MRAGRKLRTHFDNRTRSMGLTLARAGALLQLSERDMMSQTELADILDIEAPTLVRLLDGLEKQGLVERREQGRDRRVKQVALTPKGRKVGQDIGSMAAALRADLMKDIPPQDIVRATELVRQINTNLDARSTRPPEAGRRPGQTP